MEHLIQNMDFFIQNINKLPIKIYDILYEPDIYSLFNTFLILNIILYLYLSNTNLYSNKLIIENIENLEKKNNILEENILEENNNIQEENILEENILKKNNNIQEKNILEKNNNIQEKNVIKNNILKNNYDNVIKELNKNIENNKNIDSNKTKYNIYLSLHNNNDIKKILTLKKKFILKAIKLFL